MTFLLCVPQCTSIVNVHYLQESHYSLQLSWVAILHRKVNGWLSGLGGARARRRAVDSLHFLRAEPTNVPPTYSCPTPSLSPSITQAGEHFDKRERREQQRSQQPHPAVSHIGIYSIHFQEYAVDNEQDRRTRSQKVLGQEASIQAEWQSQGRQGGRERSSTLGGFVGVGRTDSRQTMAGGRCI